MSRVGKNPIEVPDGVEVAIIGQQVTAKGKLGELSMTFSDDIDIIKEANLVKVKARNNTIQSRKMWGTARSVISNLVVGVSEGFTRDLEINGVGYRAQIQGKELVLQLGFSHEIRHEIPDYFAVYRRA